VGQSIIRLDAGDFSTGHGCWPSFEPAAASLNVFVNQKKAVRVEDAYPPHTCISIPETHSSKASQGSPTVFINSQFVHRSGDAIKCGDTADNGSPDVLVGDGGEEVVPPPVPPEIEEIVPNTAKVGESPELTISGDNFTPDTTLSLIGPSIIEGTDLVAAEDGTSIKGLFPLIGAGVGIYSLLAKKPTGEVTAAPASFTVDPLLTPTVTSINPNTTLEGTPTFPVTVYGANFQEGANTFLKQGETILDILGDVTTVNEGKIEGTLNLSTVLPGLWDVEVTNPDGQSGTLNNAFEVLEIPPGPPPLITGIAPSQGEEQTILSITVYGDKFQNGADVFLEKNNVIIDVTGEVVSPTQIVGTLDLTNAPTDTFFNIVVQNPDGLSDTKTDAFEITAIPPPPTGACCKENGDCIDNVTEEECFNDTLNPMTAWHQDKLCGGTGEEETEPPGNQGFNLQPWIQSPLNGHWYARDTYKQRWDNAKIQAETMGVFLVTVRNQEENDWLRSNIYPTAKIWLGLNDIAQEGTWVWHSGEPVTYTNWNSGEPNDANNEDAVEMYESGRWNDNQTYEQKYAVYEFIPSNKITCVQPFRKCCPPDWGICEELQETACITLGGVWHPTEHCENNPCPVAPRGSCCVNDGPSELETDWSCFSDLTENECNEKVGQKEWHQDIPCITDTCPEDVIGRCCSPAFGGCNNLTWTGCMALHPAGCAEDPNCNPWLPNVDCLSNPCPFTLFSVDPDTLEEEKTYSISIHGENFPDPLGFAEFRNPEDSEDILPVTDLHTKNLDELTGTVTAPIIAGNEALPPLEMTNINQSPINPDNYHGWVLNPDNGHWYARSSESQIMFWTSENYAKSFGAHLVTIRSWEENNWIRDNIYTGHMNIGLWQDINDPNFSQPLGGWKWTSGENAGQCCWSPGEPNNANSTTQQKQEIAYMNHTSTGSWDDYAMGQRWACYEWDPLAQGARIYDLYVESDGEINNATLEEAIEIVPTLPPPPAFQSMDPEKSAYFENLPLVTITGTNFDFLDKCFLSQDGEELPIEVIDFNITTITGSLDLTQVNEPGIWDLTIETFTGDVFVSDAFEVTVPDSPVVYGITPSIGTRGDPLFPVKITGENLQVDSSAVLCHKDFCPCDGEWEECSDNPCGITQKLIHVQGLASEPPPIGGGLNWKQSSVNGHWYARSSSVKDWWEQQEVAESMGANLATIRNKDEHDWITENICLGYNSREWFGLYREQNNAPWVWISGEDEPYRNWCPGEPNYSFEHHGVLNYGNCYKEGWNNWQGSIDSNAVFEYINFEEVPGAGELNGFLDLYQHQHHTCGEQGGIQPLGDYHVVIRNPGEIYSEPASNFTVVAGPEDLGGACCFGDGTCLDHNPCLSPPNDLWSEEACEAQGGVYGGAESSCDNTYCAQFAKTPQIASVTKNSVKWDEALTFDILGTDFYSTQLSESGTILVSLTHVDDPSIKKETTVPITESAGVIQVSFPPYWPEGVYDLRVTNPGCLPSYTDGTGACISCNDPVPGLTGKLINAVAAQPLPDPPSVTSVSPNEVSWSTDPKIVPTTITGSNFYVEEGGNIKHEFTLLGEGDPPSDSWGVLSGGWKENPSNGHWYARSGGPEGKIDWSIQKDRAEVMGAYLATIRSKEENDWIMNNFPVNAWWIGFNDIAQEGTWVWHSGEPVTYTNWNSGEPNNSGDCGQLYSTGKWDDTSNGSNKYALFEWIPTNKIKGSNITAIDLPASLPGYVTTIRADFDFGDKDPYTGYTWEGMYGLQIKNTVELNEGFEDWPIYVTEQDVLQIVPPTVFIDDNHQCNQTDLDIKSTEKDFYIYSKDKSFATNAELWLVHPNDPTKVIIPPEGSVEFVPGIGLANGGCDDEHLVVHNWYIDVHDDGTLVCGQNLVYDLYVSNPLVPVPDIMPGVTIATYTDEDKLCPDTGACCDEYSGECMDGVTADSCVGPDKTFYEQTFCSDVTCEGAYPELHFMHPNPASYKAGQTIKVYGANFSEGTKVAIKSNDPTPAISNGAQPGHYFFNGGPGEFINENLMTVQLGYSSFDLDGDDKEKFVGITITLPNGNFITKEQYFFMYKGSGSAPCGETNPCGSNVFGGCCLTETFPDTLEGTCYPSVSKLGCEKHEFFGQWDEGDDCIPNQCFDPNGRCCLEAYGGCVDEVTQWECENEYPGELGTEDYEKSWIEGKSCISDPCPPEPVGACCLKPPLYSSWYCEDEVTEAYCLALGNIWTEGVLCDLAPCPVEPEGACCYPGFVPCEVTTKSNCENNSGIYHGDGTEDLCDKGPYPCEYAPPSIYSFSPTVAAQPYIFPVIFYGSYFQIGVQAFIGIASEESWVEITDAVATIDPESFHNHTITGTFDSTLLAASQDTVYDVMVSNPDGKSTVKHGAITILPGQDPESVPIISDITYCQVEDPSTDPSYPTKYHGVSIFGLYQPNYETVWPTDWVEGALPHPPDPYSADESDMTILGYNWDLGDCPNTFSPDICMPLGTYDPLGHVRFIFLSESEDDDYLLGEDVLNMDTNGKAYEARLHVDTEAGAGLGWIKRQTSVGPHSYCYCYEEGDACYTGYPYWYEARLETGSKLANIDSVKSPMVKMQPGLYKLRVENPDGKYSIYSKYFQVTTGAALPEVSHWSPKEAEIGSVTTFSVFGTNFESDATLWKTIKVVHQETNTTFNGTAEWISPIETEFTFDFSMIYVLGMYDFIAETSNSDWMYIDDFVELMESLPPGGEGEGEGEGGADLAWITNPNNGLTYAITPDKMTWYEANDMAAAHDSHLVTIRSQQENDWLMNTFAKQAWIGYYQYKEPGDLPPEGVPIAGDWKQYPVTGRWYARSSSDQMTFWECVAKAEEQGVFLATIRDEAENQWIHDTISPWHMWIGLYQDPEATTTGEGWKWIHSEEEVNTAGWGPGEPNDKGSPEAHQEDYGVVNWFSDGGWADIYDGKRFCLFEFDPGGIPPPDPDEDGPAENWHWINGEEEETYTNWAGGEPNQGQAGEDVAEIVPGWGGTWNDIRPDAPDHAPGRNPGIFERGETDVIEVPPLNWIQGPNGHQYAKAEDLHTWEEHKAIAEAAGAHLVTIRTQYENDWIKSTFGYGQWWIGLWQDRNDPNYSEKTNDAKSSPWGGWKWDSGEVINWVNWGGPNPDNSGGNQDYATFWWPGLAAATWGDSPNSDLLEAIYEIGTGLGDTPPVMNFTWYQNPLNGHWYGRDSGNVKDFWWHKDRAEANGCVLATIRSEEEQDWIHANVTQGTSWFGLWQDKSDPGWSDGTYQEPADGWKWHSGEPVTYTNWETNSPGGGSYQEAALINWPGAPSQTWNDYGSINKFRALYEFIPS